MGKTFTSKKKSTKKSKQTDAIETKPLHENFREYTAAELNKIKVEICIRHKCPYASNVAAASSTVCNYILIEQHSRGCMPDVCEYWKNKDVKKRKDIDNQHLFNKHSNSSDIY